MTKKRVVITGLGIVSCFGTNVNSFYQQLLQGKSGIRSIEEFDCTGLATKFAGTVQNFDSTDYIEKKQARRIDKFIAYATVAGKKALEMANFSSDAPTVDLKKCGIIIGSGMGGMSVFADGVKTLAEKGASRVTPFFVPYILTNMAGGLLATDLGFMGPNYSISTACATANYSIIAAANHIRSGEADLMLTGGSEAAIIPMGIAGFNACRALSMRNEQPQLASRPWDKNRDGFVMGEGAGVLVLESLEHALQRGAHIIAEYLGGAVSCDAYHMTEPRSDGAGVKLCIENALADAGISVNKVNYINCHATSTPLGDMAEINALKKVFVNPEKITLNATKSMTGHALGAAGAIEAVATVKAIEEAKVHPTINLDAPEDDLQFNIPIAAQELQVEAALSNSFGFGGHNASIVLAPFKA